MNRHIIERIQRFNRDRDPKLVKIKYEKMRSDPFAFFRGTCHLFYEDWPRNSVLNSSPPAWACGDLHVQNMGSYRGDSGLVYFDINDFDESVLTPCSWDVTRLLTSVFVSARVLKVPARLTETLSKRLMTAYVHALENGKAQTVETETAHGMVKELLDSVKHRKRKAFLDSRTKLKGQKRRLIVDGKHTMQASREKYSAIKSFFKKWASKQDDPSFYTVLDIAGRIAGIGSLGVEHYVVLVKGKGSPDQNWLLDLKEAKPSSVRVDSLIEQPVWKTEADRVVSVQQRMQGTCPALLSAVTIEGKPFILRELQPLADKIDLTKWNKSLHRLYGAVETAGAITAWDQLRSSGRQGSSTADDLIRFSSLPKWQNELHKYAVSYSNQVEQDYREFCSKK